MRRSRTCVIHKVPEACVERGGDVRAFVIPDEWETMASEAGV